MPHAGVVDFDAMRDKLLTVEDVAERLAATEPLSEVSFTTGQKTLAVHFKDDEEGKPWHKRPGTEPAPVWLQAGETYQLTAEAAQQLGSRCHMPDGYQLLVPGEMLAYDLDYWLHTGLGETELKLLIAGHGKDLHGKDVPLVQGVCRPSIIPFSNLKFLEVMLSRIKKAYGDTEVLADYKFHHDLERTALRLIVPGKDRFMTGTAVADDRWSLGLDFYSSVIGLRPSTLAGYLFRWWCTNGSTEESATSSRFSRRGSSEDDAMEWARDSVDAILGGLESGFDQLQELTAIPVEGEVVPVLQGLFKEFGVAKAERARIIETMADMGGQLSMYELQSAVTMAANIDDLDDNHVRRLLAMGGHIAHAHRGLCDACHQLLPEAQEVTAEVAAAS
jgi:hypothetical protein